MDIQGTVLIRSLKDLSEAESVLYTITSIPKDTAYAKILLNVERIGAEGEVIVIINDQLMLMDIEGRQIDSASIDDNQVLLQAANSSVLDNKFLYKLVCANFGAFVTQRWDTISIIYANIKL